MSLRRPRPTMRWCRLAWLPLFTWVTIAVAADDPGVTTGLAAEVDRGIRLLPADTAAVVLAFPRRILSNPVTGHLPSEVSLAEFERQTGIPLAKVEWLLAFWDKPDDDVLSLGLILQFSEEFDWRRLEDLILRQTKLDLLQDRPYRRGQGPLGTSLFALDERTLVLARDETLKRMVAKNGAIHGHAAEVPEQGELSPEVPDSRWPMKPATIHRRIDSSLAQLLIDRRPQRLDFHVIVSLERLRDLVPGTCMAGVPQQSADSLKQLADLVYNVEFRSRLQPEFILGLNMYCRDAEAAVAAQTIWDRWSPSSTPTAARTKLSIEAPLPAVAYLQDVLGSGLLSLPLQRRETELQMGFRRNGADQITVFGALVILMPTIGQEVQTLTARLQTWDAAQQVSRAMLEYCRQQERLPVPGNTDGDGRALLSWRVHLLPYLGHQRLYDQFHLDEAWDSPHNRDLISQMPAVFQHPEGAVDYRTTLQIPIGPGTWFARSEDRTASELAQASPNTLMLVAVDPSQAVVWTQPADLQVDVWSPGKSLGSKSETGFLGVRANGSVGFFAAPWTSEQLRALFSCSASAALRDSVPSAF